MPIAIDGKVYDDELSYTAKVLGIELPKPAEAPGSSQTKDGTQVPPPENNASGSNVGGVRGIVDNLLGTSGERYQTWPEKAVRSAIQAFALPGDVLSGKVQAGSPQEIERAMDLAGLMVAGPAPVASKMADGTLGSFAGVVSKTVDKNKLAEAQIMQHNGASVDDIWEKTGFFKGADNRWKYEISPKDATLNESAFTKNIIPDDPRTGGETNTTFSINNKPTPPGATLDEALAHLQNNQYTLPEVLNHPELYKAYPHLKDMKVDKLPGYLSNRGVIGQMDNLNNTLYLKDDLHPSFTKSVLLHEIQHSIQEVEGFAKGGSSTMFTHPNLAKAEKLYNDAIAQGGDPKSPALVKAKKIIQDELNAAHLKYTQLMGEVEARNVQRRMDFSDLNRWALPPGTTESFPRDVQIFR